MTTATHTGLLRAICERPHDTDLRLIYADWLAENGQEERAEFIRVQVELEEPYRFGQFERCADLILRERELLASARLTWEPNVLIGLMALRPETDWRWRRGFVEEVVFTCQDWLDHGPALVSEQPIVEVRLSDKEPALSGGQSEMGCYRWWGGGFLARHGHDWETDDLPTCIFRRMRSTKRLEDFVLYFDTIEAAQKELSYGCVAWARAQAGLPPLQY